MSIQSLITLKYRKITFTVIILMYLAGTIGLLIPYTQPYFKLASAFNLWISLILLLFFHKDFNKSFIFTATFILIFGFFVEVLGVHTGVIFGKYYYGQTLGIKLFDVPLVIGANWLLLVYCSAMTIQSIFSKIKTQSFFTSIFVQSLASATVMVLLDLLIEPVAIRLDFWHWQNEEIPTQNFQTWFLIALVLNYIFLNAKFLKFNSLAVLLLILQFFFFISITIFYHYF